MELNCFLWYCNVSYGNALVLHGISLYCMVLHGSARCCIRNRGGGGGLEKENLAEIICEFRGWVVGFISFLFW